ncbi:MAG TPA: ATP-binding cassette domain-containing protein, partial [Ramlibacter sp.]
MLLLPLAPVPDFWIAQSCYIGMYSLVALGLVLLTGVSGLTSFGQAAFVGVGAYTAAFMTVKLGGYAWLALPIGIGLAIVAALVVGAITLRMSGHYLPLATIAWGLALNYTMANMDWLGKYDGIVGIPTLHIGSVDLGTGRGLHVLIWAFALVAALGVMHLLDSRPGRAIRSIKGGTTMPEAMGVSTFRYKLVAFVIAAILAAISGWLFAFFQQTVNPTPFSLGKGIEYLFMAVLGGVSYVWGAFLGAAVVKLTEDQLQVILPKLIGTSGNFETIVFGIVIVGVLKYAPDGLWTFAGRWFPAKQRVRDWDSAAPLDARAKPAHGEALLQVDKVRKEFGGLVAVNDVSFSIRAGDIVALIGPNGAGKSTTFNLVTGVLPLTSGQVDFRGQPIGGLPSRTIAALGVSRTFQHVKMNADMTVLENV